MTCDQFLRAIDAYLDDELPIMEILRVHGHLISCPVCRRVMGSENTLYSLLADEASRDHPPAALAERIIQGVTAEEKLAPSGRPPGPRLGLLAVLSAVVVAVALIGFLLAAQGIPGHGETTDLIPFAAEVAAKHMLYRDGWGGALEIRTSDSSEVTRWAERHAGMSLKLPDLDQAGMRLLGGRVTSLGDAPAVYLLYDGRGRRVSLFVTSSVPSANHGGSSTVVDGVKLSTSTLRRVALVWWEEEDEGRLYAAASTGDPSALQQFVLLCARGGQAVKSD
jgi:anti-sigma factor RsiW